MTILTFRFPAFAGWSFAASLALCGPSPAASAETATSAAPTASTTATPTVYSRVPPSADGTGIVYLGRETAAVMGHEAADWLERPERVAEERPDLLLQALALKPGMRVADIGAGTGYYTWRMAERVAPAGRVYAVDVQPEMLERLGVELKRRGVADVTPVLGSTSDPHLPAGVIDVALMVDVYHEFDHPREMLTAIVKAMRDDGIVVFVEYRAEDPAVPIKPHHKMSVAQVKREAQAAGLTWRRTVETLPWQHIVIFSKTGRAG